MYSYYQLMHRSRNGLSTLGLLIKQYAAHTPIGHISLLLSLLWSTTPKIPAQKFQSPFSGQNDTNLTVQAVYNVYIRISLQWTRNQLQTTYEYLSCTFYALIRHIKNINMNNKSTMPLGIWILPLNVNHSVIRRRKT